MEEFTSREAAWLRSLEAPPRLSTGAGPVPWRSTRLCLSAAHAAIHESRQLLEKTRSLVRKA